MPRAGLAQALRLVNLLVLVCYNHRCLFVCSFVFIFIGGFESVASWHFCVPSVLSLHEWNQARIIRRKELTIVSIPPPRVIRELSAKALHNLAQRAPEYSAAHGRCALVVLLVQHTHVCVLLCIRGPHSRG